MSEGETKAKRSGGDPAAAAQRLDAQLRAMFDEVATQPTPEPVLTLIDQLDRAEPPKTGEDRAFRDD